MIIKFDTPRLGYGAVRLSNPLLLGIPEGITAVIGPNGSGKTTFGNVISKGRYAYGNRLSFPKGERRIKMLSFSDIHSLSGMEAEYMAQRMESTMNDYVPTVAKVVGTRIDSPAWKKYSEAFRLFDVADKKINYLSSGELRKLLIINALTENPDVLVLDNPYIGLDAASRAEFDEAMQRLREEGKSIILLLCDPADIPSFTDSVLTLENRELKALITNPEKIVRFRESKTMDDSNTINLPERPPHASLPHSVAFVIRDGHVRYGDRQILENLDWEVKKGECWALTGQNGSGKSLLLSMVCADNPQGYANDITLFDRRRGSGESIWEIKDAIGYVSPEMQLFFKSNSTVREIVMQGLRLSLHRYAPPTEEELSIADAWLDLLEISPLASRQFSSLSQGEQRLVLVARAMIKQPELLVLDEPLHGLDPRNKERVKEIVDRMVSENGTSLIFVTHYTSEIPSCVKFTKTLQKHV